LEVQVEVAPSEGAQVEAKQGEEGLQALPVAQVGKDLLAVDEGAVTQATSVAAQAGPVKALDLSRLPIRHCVTYA
jgi:hypothetical protein